MTIIKENLLGAAEPNVATSDENLSIDGIFQKTSLPSLARQIFSVVPVNGPTAALFNIRKNAVGDAELLRAEVAVYPSASIPTGLTSEAFQDLKSQFGVHGNDVVGKLLRGVANDDENAKTQAFLIANSPVATTVTRSNPANAQTTFVEISQHVQELVLTMNTNGLKTYDAFCVLPYTAAASVMALGEYFGGNNDTTGLKIGQVGKTSYYVNPDPLATVAYVGLIDAHDSGRSSAVFSPYESQIVEAVVPTTGNTTYHIYNRYAITLSPLSVAGDELVRKFAIV